MEIITPKKSSRKVKFRDLWRVIKDSWRIKFAMMKPFPGRFPKASSISHCQMEAEDPLRFFVLGGHWHVFEAVPMKLKTAFGFPWARTIINPKIVWHGKDTQNIKEGCMSLEDQKPHKIKRWRIVEAEYWTFFGKRKKKFYLYRAVVLQHEIDHMNNILPEEIYRHSREAVVKSTYELPT